MQATRYAAVVFADLERHSNAWTRTPREKMVSLIAEYRYLAESFASQYGAFHGAWTGDGHMFLFENADAATRFGIRLIASWKGSLSLRVGCHFGQCTAMEEEGWIGHCNAVAKRVESEAQSNTLLVTETVLDLLDLPVYEFEEAGAYALKGDHLPSRTLYRVSAFDRAALASKPPDELTTEDWFLKGVSLIGTEQEWSDEEADCYREALRLRSDYPEAHNNLAIVLRARGDDQAAAGHYQEALRLRPEYPEAHSNYAAMLAARGSRGAEQHYREALRLRPEHPEAHSNYAVLLEDLGRKDEAEHHYREAVRIRPDLPEGHYNFALFLDGAGDAAGAESHYGEAIRLRPDYGEARNNLAILLQRRGELTEAADQYREALRLRPDDPETHYNFALLLQKTGDDEGAEQHLRTARELAP